MSAAEIAYRYARPELEARAAKEKAAEDAELGPKSKRKNKKKGGPASTRDVAAAAKPEKDPRRDLTEKIIGLDFGDKKPDFSAFPNITAFMARVAARPAVQEAMKAEGLLKAA